MNCPKRDKDRTSFLRLAVCGLLCGAANGLFGSAGGALLVILLTKWAGLEQKKAFATTVAAVLAMSCVSAVIYQRGAPVDLGAALPYCAGGAAGGIIGGVMMKRVRAGALRRLFGLLIIWAGIRAVMGL